jgi:O-antigen/teichoic acid export membrane protein
VIWRCALSILLIPFYVRHLPANEWGIVAICIAAQGFLTLLDAGLAQIIPRDIARVRTDQDELARKFSVFSRAYLILATCGFCVGQLAVPWLMTHWIKIADDTSSEVYASLRLAFFMFFFQFWNTVHLGYWNGLQEQHRSNISQVVFTTAKHAAAVILMLTWAPTAEAYLTGFTLCSAAEWATNRLVINRSLSHSNLKVRVADLLTLMRKTGMLSIGVVLGLLVSQTDRIVLSNLLPIDEYGRYIAVATLGLAFFQCQGPLLTAFYPRLSVELPLGDTRSLRRLTLGIVALNVIPCLIAALTTPFFLALWMHNPEIVELGTRPLQLIFLAIAINSIYQIFYQQILVHGHATYVVWTNAANIVLVGSFIFLMAPHIGVMAGGWGWLIGSSIQLLAGAAWALFFKTRGKPTGTNINRFT